MVINALRDIGGFIDKAIYWFVELLLQLILDLADTQIFSQSVITEFANRIYIILGLVMLFKIIISFIQILINPDKMDDKEQGVGNILMRVVISLLLIVLVPSIFSLARQLQSYIIPIIPKVVLGTEAGSTDGDMMNTSGRAMAFYSYTAFFTYNNPECNDGSIYGTGNDPMKVTVYDVPSAVTNINEKCPDSSDENGYRYKYDWPMSMIVGIYLVFMLVQIAVAVAIRAIKLGICEFIAPIPIASYIDPKTSKQAFDNWVSTSIKTYLDLFTRLIVVYFVVFVFMIIIADETFDTILASVGGDTTRQALVVIAIIIGLLQFAKQAPKFISDMLGVKEGMGDIGAMFKGAGAMAAAVGGAGIAGLGNIFNARHSGQSWSKALGSGVAGWASGMYHGNKAALSGKGIKDSFTSSTQTPWKRRNLRAADKAGGAGVFDRMRVGMLDYVQVQDDISLAEGIQKSITNVQSADKEYKAVMGDKMNKNASNITWGSIAHGGSQNLQNLKSLMNQAEVTAAAASDSYLADIQSALNKTGSNFGKKANGTYVTYGDLFALRASAHNLGLSELEAQLNGDLFLKLDKEMKDDGRRKAILDANGSISKINDDKEVVRARDALYQRIAIESSNIGITSYKDASGTSHELKNIQDWQNAYTHNPSDIDNTLNERYSDVSRQIANSKTAAARASNQRWKNSGK